MDYTSTVIKVILYSALYICSIYTYIAATVFNDVSMNTV